MRCLWCGHLIARGKGVKWERAERLYSRDKKQYELVTTTETLHRSGCNDKRIAWMAGRTVL